MPCAVDDSCSRASDDVHGGNNTAKLPVHLTSLKILRVATREADAEWLRQTHPTVNMLQSFLPNSDASHVMASAMGAPRHHVKQMNASSID